MNELTHPRITVLIPAFDEEISLPMVLAAIPKPPVGEVVVCDNGSRDGTAAVAAQAGATVVMQPARGYGNACLAGMAYVRAKPLSEQPDIIVFLDADYSDHPEELPEVIRPILEGRADMVIGSRRLGRMEPGAMTFPQRFGNWLAPALIRLFFGVTFTDLGPFRAIRWESLLALDMQDTNFGWTVEMQAKAARMGLRSVEVPVRYRKRAGGKSKVSGSIRGAFRAGVKILYTIGAVLLRR